MPHPFYSKNQELLERAVEAIGARAYWSPFPEMPSPKIYGESASDDGKAAFEARLNKPFAAGSSVGQEVSPYGIELGITYPATGLDALIARVAKAQTSWRNAGPEVWCGVSIEILKRINQRSFEIAHAVMHTTGQAFMMAFQAGAPHAQDRGLEAVAYAWSEMKRIPRSAYWEKPQGKNPPLSMEKRFRVIPRGIAVVIGCCTFPTWNAYPGMFASLATGNSVIVKPHPGSILPLAISVEIAREVLAEAGFDPDVVTLAAHDFGDDLPQRLALQPEVRIIDFTGSPENGEWLERTARHAQVYTEKAGVNQIIVDSTSNFQGMVKNIAFSLALYSGQMCTAPQNIYVPAAGIDTNDGHLSFDAVATALGKGIEQLVSDPARAVEILGAVQNEGIATRIKQARGLGDIVADSRAIPHPVFPLARIRTPLLLKTTADDESKFAQELFGPIAFVIATQSTAASIDLSKRIVKSRGALTLSVYSTSTEVIDQAVDAAAEAGVALSCNLTSGVYVNQSAAFSDFHGTGCNPAANASLTDSAFVAGRFRVAQSRVHVEPRKATA